MEIRRLVVRFDSRIPVYGAVRVVISTENAHVESFFQVQTHRLKLLKVNASAHGIVHVRVLAFQFQGAEIPCVVDIPVEFGFIIQGVPGRSHFCSVIAGHGAVRTEENFHPVVIQQVQFGLWIFIDGQRGIIDFENEFEGGVSGQTGEMGVVLEAVPRRVESADYGFLVTTDTESALRASVARA